MSVSPFPCELVGIVCTLWLEALSWMSSCREEVACKHCLVRALMPTQKDNCCEIIVLRGEVRHSDPTKRSKE